MVEYTWQSGDTWHKVAYKRYGDETQYRTLLAANTHYNLRNLPTPGDKIAVPEQGADSLFGSKAVNDRRDKYYFPWIDPRDYYQRLSEYNGVALLATKELNGPLLLNKG